MRLHPRGRSCSTHTWSVEQTIACCRMHKEGECAASECSHMCNDFMRSGFTNFIVDPSVRQVASRLSSPAHEDTCMSAEMVTAVGSA